MAARAATLAYAAPMRHTISLAFILGLPLFAGASSGSMSSGTAVRESLIASPSASQAAPPPVTRQVPPATHAANTPAPRADQFWVDRHALLKFRVQEASQRGDIDVVFLGDSITQGWEGEGRQAWDDAFSGRVVDGLPTPRGLNLGISGDRTEHVLYRVLDGTLDPLAAPASGRPPRVAVIMIGTNNSHGDQYTARQIADGVVAVTRSVQSRLPGIRVLLLNIFPRNVNKDAQRAKVEAASELAWTDLEGDPSIRRMDLGGLFTSPDGVLDLELMPDALHLSARGYRVWASAIEPAIGRAIRTGPSPWGTAVVDLRERLRARGIAVRQQGRRDASTVFAFVAALEYAAVSATPEGVPAPDFSEQYLMWAANQAAGGSRSRTGGFDPEALAAGLRAWGVCDEALMPYVDRDEAIAEPGDAAKAQGRQRTRFTVETLTQGTMTGGLTPEVLAAATRSLDVGRPVVAVFGRPSGDQDESMLDDCRTLIDDGIDDGVDVGSRRHSGALLIGYGLDADHPGKGYFIARFARGEWFGEDGDAAIPFEYARKHGIGLSTVKQEP